MAVSQRFEQAYRRLVAAFGVHQYAPRSADDVHELAAARALLEDRRSQMADARDDEDLEPFKRINPDWVDPRDSLYSTGHRGKIAAVIGAALLALMFLLIVSTVQDFLTLDTGGVDCETIHACNQE
ncbi:MAG: hypothetical protein AAF480_12585 [Actinomycetota bacterium]